MKCESIRRTKGFENKAGAKRKKRKERTTLSNRVVTI